MKGPFVSNINMKEVHQLSMVKLQVEPARIWERKLNSNFVCINITNLTHNILTIQSNK